MNSTIYSTPFGSYQVKHIAYATYIREIPEEYRKNERSHSFRIVTRTGSIYYSFTNEESAKKAHGALTAKLQSYSPDLFRSGGSILDTSKVVSFSSVLTLKKPQGNKTHAFWVTVDTENSNENKLWFSFTSEENAEKARRALFAKVNMANSFGTTVHDELVQEESLECV